MDALIIAAGRGSRLGSAFASKPLAPVCGVPLIEIAIAQARAAGARRAVVVTGYKAAQVETELAAIEARRDIEIAIVRLTDWSRANGYSVIAGAKEISGPFLLMMADHIFCDGLLNQLASQHLDGCDVVLAVDRRIDSPLIDPEDATWVDVAAGAKISAIGKQIGKFNAVDCGAFLANEALPRAISLAISRGLPGGISDGMQILADRGRASTMEIGNRWWIDVDDPRAHRLAQAHAPTHLGILAPGKSMTGNPTPGDLAEAANV